ncbi:MAG: HlyD family efflux transporter periplasmic adaptor subunit, partial [Candidatus Solibacter usitatus]|nr:HlyD family efflux transporter periplasmic adaptor subunit [Candidatus Solibacter usitatus]
AVLLQIRRGSEYAQVQAGDPVPAGLPYVQVVDPSSMVVNANINQVDVERIRVGAKARIRFDAFPELAVPGHVYSVAAMPKSSNSSRGSFLKEIPVRIKLDQMDPRVIPGLSVSVDVIVEEEEAPAVAPASAVFRDAHASTPYVFVKSSAGWDRREVQTGVASYTHVAIRGGLKAGEIIAEERPPDLTAIERKPSTS